MPKDNLLPYPRTRARKGAAETAGDRSQITRLALGSYFADIVPGKLGGEQVFHWVIQQVGSAEILRLGQELSFAHALDRAHECLENLVFRRENQGKRTVFYEFGQVKR